MVGLGRDICCYYNRLFQEMIPVFHCNKYLRTVDNINDTPAKSGEPVLVRRFGLRYSAALTQRLYVFLIFYTCQSLRRRMPIMKVRAPAMRTPAAKSRIVRLSPVLARVPPGREPR